MDNPVVALPAAQPLPKGFVDTIKEKISWESLKEKLDFSQDQLIEMATYFGIGFFSGFLFKKYAKFFLFAIGLLAAFLWYFQSSGFVTFHWEAIQEFFAISDVSGLEQIFYSCIDWVKAHAMISSSFGIGFLVGYKVG